MRKMPTVRQVKPQNRVTRLQHGHVHRHVRLRTRVRLYVRMVAAEQLLDPFAREVLGLVDILAATVVAAAGVPLGVLIGHHAAQRL